MIKKILATCLLFVCSCASNSTFFGAKMLSDPIVQYRGRYLIECAYVQGWSFASRTAQDKVCVCRMPPEDSLYGALGWEAYDFILAAHNDACERVVKQ